MYSNRNISSLINIINVLLILSCLIKCNLASSYNNNNTNNNNNSDLQETISANSNKYFDKFHTSFVATTPKITEVKPLSRYEQGLDDYEEAIYRIKNETDSNSESLANSNLLVVVFNMISESFLSKRNLILDDVEQSTHSLNTSSTKILSIHRRDISNDSAVAEGRYIQGDPLNGYYDFIITEGSYKFWAVFQLGTAALIIYSTFAAIYYSKVNPLTGDYDYVDYLSRSFHGRAITGDDDDDVAATSAQSFFSSSNLLSKAGHSFQFILDAIDKVPQ